MGTNHISVGDGVGHEEKRKRDGKVGHEEGKSRE